MDTSGAVAFWSYAHQDNERDGGGVTRLAARIQDEFALVTGEPLSLFLDRNDILWGEEWRRRIDTTLVETTFFIPVITPLYFKRPECRHELLSFVGHAQSLGAIELVMPILYVDVPGLTEESTDEACALIARMQYADWRHIRLLAEDSAEYRQGVNSLAMRLAEISNRYEQNVAQVDTQAIEGEDEEGLLDLLGSLEEKLNSWQEYILDSKIIWQQVGVISEPYFERLRKLSSQAQRVTSGQLSVLHKLAEEVEPLLRRDVDLRKAFSSTSIELDPVVLKIFRNLDTYSEFSESVLRALAPIEEAYKTIEKDEKRAKGLDGVINRYRGISRDILRLSRLVEAGTRYARDGNALIKNWHQEIRQYMGGSRPPGPGSCETD